MGQGQRPREAHQGPGYFDNDFATRGKRLKKVKDLPGCHRPHAQALANLTSRGKLGIAKAVKAAKTTRRAVRRPISKIAEREPPHADRTGTMPETEPRTPDSDASFGGEQQVRVARSLSSSPRTNRLGGEKGNKFNMGRRTLILRLHVLSRTNGEGGKKGNPNPDANPRASSPLKGHREGDGQGKASVALDDTKDVLA